MKHLRCIAFSLVAAPSLVAALGREVHGPPGSERFGASVHWLPNGNLVVSDPDYDAPGPVPNVGAVHLYSPDGTLLSTLRGSSPDDRIGTRIDVLAGGDFVVSSPGWNNPGNAAISAGAVTWRSATAAVDAEVHASNSIIGARSGDRVGSGGAFVLPDGHYLVLSPNWSDATLEQAGAITWCNGAGGGVGPVDADNSIIGSSSGDAIGAMQPVALATGKVVIPAPRWDNGEIADAGAVRVVDSDGPVAGPLTSANSLVGSRAGDMVGGGVVFFHFGGGVDALPGGNFVVRSPLWDNGDIVDAGAVTWVDGDAGLTGPVSPGNSLVGTSESDHVSYNGFGRSFVVLGTGNYLVLSSYWRDAAGFAQAVTFGDASTPLIGPVGPQNSLVGNVRPGSKLLGATVSELSNGNAVVTLHAFRADDSQVSASVFVDGNTGASGAVSAAAAMYNVRVQPLPNGNYVLSGRSEFAASQVHPWSLWVDGDIGHSGAALFSDILLGPPESAGAEAASVIALSNGNYVFVTPSWRDEHGTVTGAATWVDGALGLVGEVTAQNSLVGTSSLRIGQGYPLTNGHYVLVDEWYGEAGFERRGAVTWVDGSRTTIGTVSPSASLLGAQRDSFLGADGIRALSNGNLLVPSLGLTPGSSGTTSITWLHGHRATSGVVSEANSLAVTEDGARIEGVGVHADGSYVVASSRGQQRLTTPGAGVDVLAGVPNGLNSIVSDFESVYLAYDPVRRRLARADASGLRVTIVDLSDLPSDGFTDGFEPPY